jgi:adenylosuccinate synthase
VGSGPFPTELFDEVGAKMAKIGHEFGSVTGRARRCGWLDLVALKYAVEVNGVTQLFMMKGDVLSGFSELKVCVAYDYKGQEISHLPFNIEEENVKPLYKTFKGWAQDISKGKTFGELPAELKDYISYIEDYLQVPIQVVSVGPDRTQTIFK